ncbi:MAG: protoporphyrinogen oxidase [Rhodopirellula sp.]|nr:protoporphyrinogen oxidase [Rhodopirellula sp.]OUX49921.1 MAG: protoporphyrinogen oxidase [Rhodopirellula sp. TMED283]
MNDKTLRRVAIIGGGLSGLSTAAKLHRLDQSIQLVLFESGERLGGVIHTEQVGEYLIDHGADMFSTKPSAAIDFCCELGLEDQLIEPKPEGRGARIVRNGQLVPIPEGFVLMRATQLWPMLFTPLLSLQGKLRFLLERWISPTKGDKDESVSTFVQRRMGHEVLDRIVAPLAAGIYTADVTKLSMQTTMQAIARMEKKHGSLARATAVRRRKGEDSVERGSTGARYGQFRTFQDGMIGLINGIAQSLPDDSIHLNCSVESIRSIGNQWIVTESGTDHKFDHVVVAVPPKAAVNLLEPIAPLASAELAKIESASAAIVVLGVSATNIKRPVNTFGFVVPLSEKRRILAGSFASHKFSGRSPEDHVLIRVFMGGAMQSELLEKSDEELTTIAQEELSELIGLTGDPLVSRVVRWNDAMPQYHIGHGDRVRIIDEEIASTPGLSFTSNALHGVGIAPVIKQADQVAHEVIASLKESGNTSNG